MYKSDISMLNRLYKIQNIHDIVGYIHFPSGMIKHFNGTHFESTSNLHPLLYMGTRYPVRIVVGQIHGIMINASSFEAINPHTNTYCSKIHNINYTHSGWTRR